MNKFRQRYDEMKKNSNTEKLVSTSELLDWVRLIYYYFQNDELKLTSEEKLPEDKILYPEVLYKTLNDYKQFYEKGQS